jgi:2-hydroxycyclohexanecarboxyl-CoA dehydrogenase
MHTDLSDRVAVVFGGTKGIGRACVLKLAGCGARVVFQGRDEASARAIAQECNGLAGAVTFAQADLSSYEGVQGTIARAVKEFGKVDVVVASGGPRQPRPKLFVDMAPGDAMAMLQSRLLPRLHALHAAVSHMRDRGYGKIILLTTDAARTPTPSESMVGAAGASVMFLTRALAAELAGLGIRVNAVATTLTTGTPPHDEYLLARESGSNEVIMKAFAKVEKRVKFRINTPEDLAEYVLFLASPESDQISGSTLSINGGLSFPGY